MAETEGGTNGATAVATTAKATTAVGPAQEKAAAVVKPREIYSKETLGEIQAFFKKRAKNPIGFTFDAKGNLETKEGAKVGKGKKVETQGTIRLKPFVPLDPSDRAAIEEARMESLTLLDEEYEQELLTLREAWQQYTLVGAMGPALASNKRLMDIDARRNAVRSAVREVLSIENPTIRDIILSDRYEERKMFGNDDPFDKEIARLCFYTFSPETDQGKYVQDDEAGEDEAAAAEEASAEKPTIMTYRQRLKDGRYARIFYDTDSETNGFLSPMWIVEFTVNISVEARYSSPLQAYEVERAKELGKNELATSLLKTRSPRTIRLMTRQVQGHPKDAKGIWLKIYTAVYEQHPILKAKLLATATDTLVFADTREGPSSVGLAEKDSGILDPAKWKSENAVGLAQETVRTRLREGTLEEAPETGEAAVTTITEGEQKAAKVGAIINARRRG